jgi:hypothetical protein
MNTTNNRDDADTTFSTRNTPGAIHYSVDEEFPIWRTPCGRVGPATNRWQYVTCDVCIELRPAFEDEEGLADAR